MGVHRTPNDCNDREEKDAAQHKGTHGDLRDIDIDLRLLRIHKVRDERRDGVPRRRIPQACIRAPVTVLRVQRVRDGAASMPISSGAHLRLKDGTDAQYIVSGAIPVRFAIILGVHCWESRACRVGRWEWVD